MYDLTLANVCQFLQSQDHNGDYLTLFNEVLNGHTTKSEAYEACRNALINGIADIDPTDNEELNKWRGWLEYLNR